MQRGGASERGRSQAGPVTSAPVPDGRVSNLARRACAGSRGRASRRNAARARCSAFPRADLALTSLRAAQAAASLALLRACGPLQRHSILPNGASTEFVVRARARRAPLVPPPPPAPRRPPNSSKRVLSQYAIGLLPFRLPRAWERAARGGRGEGGGAAPPPPARAHAHGEETASDSRPRTRRDKKGAATTASAARAEPR